MPDPRTRAIRGSHADLYMLGLSNAAGYMIASDGQLTITLTDQGTLVFK